jgi:hypothetical protein
MSPFRRDPPQLWPGLFDGFPAALGHALVEPAFRLDEVTFALWSLGPDGPWRRGPVEDPRGARDPDGSARLLWIFDGDPATYARFAAEYHEVDLDPALVARLYADEPVTPALVRAVRADADVNAVLESAETMGMKTAKKTAAPKPAVKPKAAAKKTTAKKPKDEDDDWDELIGEAEFKVIRVGDEVKLVIGGKVAAGATNRQLYYDLLAHVREALAKKSG